MSTSLAIPRPAAPAPAWVYWLAGICILVGSAGVIWVMHQALFEIPPHINSQAFFIIEPEQPLLNSQMLYDSYRIFFVHLPSAYSAAIMSVLIGVGGLLTLISRRSHWELMTVAAAQVGIVACFVTMATGYFWGAFAWGGQGWHFNDPRLSATLVLWLSYISLVLIRNSIDDPVRRRNFTAIYGLMTVPLYPLVSRAIEIFGKVVHPISLTDLTGSGGPVAALKNNSVPTMILLLLGFALLRYLQLRVAEDSKSVRIN